MENVKIDASLNSRIATLIAAIDERSAEIRQDETLLALKLEKDQLVAQRANSLDAVKRFMNKLPLGAEVTVTTKTGPQDAPYFNTYVGTVEKNYGHGCINLVCEVYNEGKPFTIGSSCVSYLGFTDHCNDFTQLSGGRERSQLKKRIAELEALAAFQAERLRLADKIDAAHTAFCGYMNGTNEAALMDAISAYTKSGKRQLQDDEPLTIETT